MGIVFFFFFFFFRRRQDDASRHRVGEQTNPIGWLPLTTTCHLAESKGLHRPSTVLFAPGDGVTTGRPQLSGRKRHRRIDSTDSAAGAHGDTGADSNAPAP